MAHCADDLVLIVGFLDQRDRGLVVGQVPQRTVAAGVENRVILVHVDIAQLLGAGEHFLGVGVAHEPFGRLGEGVVGLTVRVNWRLAALGRGKGDVGSGVLEHVIGRSELFEPETGLVSGVAHLVV